MTRSGPGQPRIDDGRVRVSVDAGLEPGEAFCALVDELTTAFARRGIRFERVPEGRVVQGDGDVGRVTAWVPDRRVAFEWRPVSWEPETSMEVEVRFEPAEGGTRVTIDHRGLNRILGAGDLLGWFASEVAGAALSAATPAAFGDWITDRQARRPSGAEARATYRDPIYHYPNFGVILAELALTPDDRFLEVGCGGGALLKAALERGCTARAVDHSPEMVRVARDANADAIADGRLEVLEAGANRLPFEDGTFTAAAMTGVLGFLDDPVGAFAEIRRVLEDGGRFVGLGSDPKWRGTPAAPEPMASRLRFYEEEELEALAREAGFGFVEVVRRDLEPYARAGRVPADHIALFADGPEMFIVARKT